MKRWNAFGLICAPTIVVWSAGALIAASLHNWHSAESLGIMAWVAFIAQYQWGRP